MVTPTEPGGRRWEAAEQRWVLGVCLARVGFAVIPTVYAAAQPLLMVDWGMSASQAGWIHSVFILCYMTSLFCVGFLVDRYGAKRVYLTSCLLATAGTLLFAFLARGFYSGIVLIGLVALVKGGVYTPMFSIFTQQIRPQRRGRAIGLYVAASDGGNALALIMTSLILRIGNWPAAFVCSALGPALGSLLAYWNLRHMPNVIPPPSKEKMQRGSVRTVLTNKPALLNTWGYAWHNWELLGMRAWIPTFFTAVAGAGMVGSTRAASRGAVFAAIMYVVAIGGNLVGGSLSDVWGRTRVILLMACLSLVCSFTIGWLVSLPLWVVVIVGLLYNFTAIGDSAALSTQLTELVPQHQLGVALSVRAVLGFAPGMISPWLFGWVVDWAYGSSGAMGTFTWGMAFSCLGLGALLGPLGIFPLHRLSERAAGGAREAIT